MRRWWPVVAVTVACVLAGCTPDAAEPGAAKSQPAAASGTAQAALEGFVEVVRSSVPEVAAERSDEEIQAVADSACADLAAGKAAHDVVTATRSLGTLDAEATDQATARELIKLAIDTTCPDQAGRVDEF
ncbi:DUF732 domain-containing protein [Actinoplanes aureus]|uniref:DUF732 domain-containing protein n=1 Tax=Actinoplanes aureus TaxID=2792083 RepID=A0A931FYY9_9ACTN|nr:DUF732 domain-containing protein [Actinoplanes aureus]MBG0564150.1 DUF732 domain-containing protein [Actinoplanes aureus]